MFGIQEQSTKINVQSYWPSVVASGAMLLATDALSKERTLGSYTLSSCDRSSHLISCNLTYLQGSADLLLKFAKTHDAYSGQLLKQHIFDTSMQQNVTELRQMIDDDGFAEMCRNWTDAERTEIIVKWGHDTAVYILTIDDIRGSFVIPSILQVNRLIISCDQSQSAYNVVTF